MNRKKWYWIIGIAAAIVIAALIWGASTYKKAPGSSPEPTATDGGRMDHAGMDHGSGEQEPSGQPEDFNLRGYLEDQDAIMAAMMTDMENIEHSDSASIDFLTGMIPHHDAAINMAQSYLKYGGAHEVLAPLAQDIITAQTAEIEQMQEMIETLRETGVYDEAQAKAYLEAYDGLMDHSMSHAAAKSLDEAFADGMIMHHQMAVDMANAILSHTDEEGVKALAQTIVEAQEKEISEMRDVLNNLKVS